MSLPFIARWPSLIQKYENEEFYLVHHNLTYQGHQIILDEQLRSVRLPSEGSVLCQSESPVYI